MGFQNACHSFENLVVWLGKSLGKVLEIFLKEFLRTLIKREMKREVRELPTPKGSKDNF